MLYQKYSHIMCKISKILSKSLSSKSNLSNEFRLKAFFGAELKKFIDELLFIETERDRFRKLIIAPYLMKLHIMWNIVFFKTINIKWQFFSNETITCAIISSIY